MDHTYRVFHLDASGRICRAELMLADTDAEAMQRLGTIANHHGVELWDRARPIGAAAPYGEVSALEAEMPAYEGS